MKTHTAALRNIIYCTEPTGLPPVAPSLDGQLYILGLGECGCRSTTQDGMGHCMQTGYIIARKPMPDYRPLQGWTRGSRPNGQRGPAGEGGSELRNVSEEAVIKVHPSSGMGTRSHSLTRHKAGCVCERGGGPRGVLMGNRPRPLYIHQQITNLAPRHAYTSDSKTQVQDTHTR